MPKMTEAVTWFKGEFGDRITTALGGTPFSSNLLTAVAMQETYYIWGDLYRRLPAGEVLKLCVGDTLDSPKRSVFPKNKADLLSVPRGGEMFAVARGALESLGEYSSRYFEVAKANKDKFCHGFGIFQYDIQFFRTNPDYFLERRWYNFEDCLAVCITELKAALRRTYGRDKTSLTDQEMVYVAIAYNRGRVDFSRGFKQGYKDESGKYYGEHMWEYLKLATSVP